MHIEISASRLTLPLVPNNSKGLVMGAVGKSAPSYPPGRDVWIHSVEIRIFTVNILTDR